jgi:hypothetical protein
MSFQEAFSMNSPAGKNPSRSQDPAMNREQPDRARALDDSRGHLAQLLGRLLARQWLRDRQRRGPDRQDADEPARRGLA